MLYVTGDTHAEFSKFNTGRFPAQKEMTKEDFVIVCGDFGGVWDRDKPSKEEKYWLKWLDKKPFTLLFVDGNHENFDRLLHDYPVVDFHGGKAHRISKSVFHLMRGYVFQLDGRKVFAFGGASSHDIGDGVLSPGDYQTFQHMLREYRLRLAVGQMVRAEHVDWWKEELPSAEEMDRGIRELEKTGFCVDLVVSHSLPQSAAAAVGSTTPDVVTLYFDKLVEQYGLRFERWYSGHYHLDQPVNDRYVVKYHDIERIH